MELCLSYHCMVNKLSSRGGATIGQWIRLCLPSCRPAFESQANHLLFSQFVFELCHVEKTKINKKEAIIGPFLKKTIVKSIQLSHHITFFKYQLTKICWDLIAPPSISDFSSEVDFLKKNNFILHFRDFLHTFINNTNFSNFLTNNSINNCFFCFLSSVFSES